MATPERHLAQARQNRAFAELLLRRFPRDSTALQWAVTAAFYCAVHAMQAYLLRRGADPRTHVARDACLADPRFGVPGGVYDAYVKLKLRSEAGRYYLGQFSAGRVRTEILDTYLVTVVVFAGL